MFLAAVASIAGAGLSYAASQAAAENQMNIAKYNAALTQQQANLAEAQGAGNYDLKMQQTGQVAGGEIAAEAAGGVASNRGSSLLLDTQIQRTGTFQGDLMVAGANNQQAQLQGQAQGQLYAGEIQAQASQLQGDMSLLSGIGSAFGTASRYFG